MRNMERHKLNFMWYKFSFYWKQYVKTDGGLYEKNKKYFVNYNYIGIIRNSKFLHWFLYN